MKGPFGFAIVSAVAMLAAMIAAGGAMKPAMAGFGLSFANGLAGCRINRRAVALKGERAVLASLAAHAVRAMGLLLVIVAVRMRMGSECLPFVAATIAGYFVFLFGEIARLARS